MRDFANRVVIIGKGDAIKAVIIDDPRNVEVDQ
jgi:hypothetical protein